MVVEGRARAEALSADIKRMAEANVIVADFVLMLDLDFMMNLCEAAHRPPPPPPFYRSDVAGRQRGRLECSPVWR